MRLEGRSDGARILLRVVLGVGAVSASDGSAA
jgi:hypothetical protein